MPKKIERFINFIRQVVTYPSRRIKLLHDKLIQLDDKKIQESRINSPLDVFVDWIVEVIQYGLLLSFVWIVIFGWDGFWNYILLMFMFGTIRWIWLDLVKTTSQAVRE